MGYIDVDNIDYLPTTLMDWFKWLYTDSSSGRSQTQSGRFCWLQEELAWWWHAWESSGAWNTKLTSASSVMYHYGFYVKYRNTPPLKLQSRVRRLCFKYYMIYIYILLGNDAEVLAAGIFSTGSPARLNAICLKMANVRMWKIDSHICLLDPVC